MQRHLLVLTAESKNPQAVAGDSKDMRLITAIYTVHFPANTHTHTHKHACTHTTAPDHEAPSMATSLCA